MVAQLSNAANSRECAVKDAREKDRDGVIVHPSCAGVVRSCAAIERGSKSQKLGVQILSFLDELVHRGHSDFGILIVARVHIRSRPFQTPCQSSAARMNQQLRTHLCERVEHCKNKSSPVSINPQSWTRVRQASSCKSQASCDNNVDSEKRMERLISKILISR